jgi:hypothetical protein
MLKTVLVIVVAAACPGAIVGFVPAPSPADAASARVADGRNAGCTQPWPYYERACLGDSRKRSSNAHAVRVIALANPGAPHTPQARR